MTLPDNDKHLVIAVDGLAASGKGTLAKKLSSYFKIAYLDTGKLYRAVAYKLLEKGYKPDNIPQAILAATSLVPSDWEHHSGLHSDAVTQTASIVSAIPEVRKALLAFQRSVASHPLGAVLDGRDIGTVVCPDATIKLFVTASIETRALRRHEELTSKGLDEPYEQVLENLKMRDSRDTNRLAAPLIKAKDAYLIDTTNEDPEQVFKRALQYIKTQLHA